MRGRKPRPTALKRLDGNPGKRALNHAEPVPPPGLPDCPEHLSEHACAEWHRLAEALHGMGVLTLADRAALAAYCQAYGRWVEAEEKLKETPAMIRTPSGYVQQSPWMSVANKQLELMGRYMAELGLTPAARSRIVNAGAGAVTAVISSEPIARIEHVIVHPDRRAPADRAEQAREWEARHCTDASAAAPDE
jgi:P27 family predicted phage terminase small subunit